MSSPNLQLAIAVAEARLVRVKDFRDRCHVPRVPRGHLRFGRIFHAGQLDGRAQDGVQCDIAARQPGRAPERSPEERNDQPQVPLHPQPQRGARRHAPVQVALSKGVTGNQEVAVLQCVLDESLARREEDVFLLERVERDLLHSAGQHAEIEAPFQETAHARFRRGRAAPEPQEQIAKRAESETAPAP